SKQAGQKVKPLFQIFIGTGDIERPEIRNIYSDQEGCRQQWRHLKKEIPPVGHIRVSRNSHKSNRDQTGAEKTQAIGPPWNRAAPLEIIIGGFLPKAVFQPDEEHHDKI